MKKNNIAPTSIISRPVLLTGFGLLVLTIGIVGFMLLKHTPSPKIAVIPSKQPASKLLGSAQNSSTSVKASANNSTSTPEQTNVAKSSTPSAGTTGEVLNSPAGSFVSNHHPSLSGASAPSTEQSACSTTPGATCSIIFMKDGITKKLIEQVADSTGSTFWSWDVKDAGLSEGAWTIQAVSTLNGQVKKSNDQIELIVAS